MLTFEERERHAYVDGDVVLASVLREAIDVETERVLNLDFEVRQLQEEVHSLENQLGECDCA